MIQTGGCINREKVIAIQVEMSVVLVMLKGTNECEKEKKKRKILCERSTLFCWKGAAEALLYTKDQVMEKVPCDSLASCWKAPVERSKDPLLTQAERERERTIEISLRVSKRAVVKESMNLLGHSSATVAVIDFPLEAQIWTVLPQYFPLSYWEKKRKDKIFRSANDF